MYSMSKINLIVGYVENINKKVIVKYGKKYQNNILYYFHKIN